MSKHTKGPWSIGEYKIYASQFSDAEYPIHAPKRGRIARCYREVDAKLIASAPELLEALERMLEQFNEISIDCSHDEEMAILKARQALAKSKGE